MHHRDLLANGRPFSNTLMRLVFVALAFFYVLLSPEPGFPQSVVSDRPAKATKASSYQNGELREALLSETENAYNPIPSPDGSLIAFVRTGWGAAGGTGGVGRSNLVSEVFVMDPAGRVLTKRSLANAFLQGWSADGKFLICSRDGSYSLVTPSGKMSFKGNVPYRSNDAYDVSERVSFLSDIQSVIWLQNYYDGIVRTKLTPATENLERLFARATIQGSTGEFAKYDSSFDDDAVLIPSPNEQYLALIGSSDLQIYDRKRASWTNLGEIIVHPDKDWDYIKPTWNPWFADSSRLVFLTASGVVTSSPDGKVRRTIYDPKSASGLPVPSPDGKWIAFVTFEPRPMKIRQDLKFWGGSTIWLVPTDENGKPRPVTQKSQDTTVSLRWLNSHSIVFDRIADESLYRKARLWKAEVLQ